jgi:small subunit ribosomal protein S18
MADYSERGPRSPRGRSQGSRSGGDGDSDDRRGGGHYRRAPKVCAFCADKQLEIDYKQPDLLWRYLTSRGKIRPRRQTGSCAKHQRRLSVAIKRARHLALIPFVAEYPRSN